MLAQIETIIKATDHAALKDDRWMFIALLVIGISIFVLLVKWFMARWDSSDQRVTQMQDQLNAVRDAHIHYLQGVNEQLATVLAKNTAVIEANTVMSNQKMTLLTRMENLLEQTITVIKTNEARNRQTSNRS
jgi:hypothetical protein